MSTVAEINQRIAVANAESKKLNNERNINLGKKQTLETQLKQALAKYKADFGVDLTLDNLQAETSKALAEKEAELNKIEGILALINEGRYTEAREMSGEVVEDTTEQADTPTDTVAPPVVEPVAPSVTPPPVAEPITTPKVEAVTPPVTPPPVAEPTTPPVVEPVAPPPTTSTSDEGAKPSINLSGIDALADFVAPPPFTNKTEEVKPATTPTKDEVVTPDLTSFSAILGGTAFQA